MPLDAVFLTAVVRELRDQILGARIDKIHQPDRDTVLLSLRGQSGPGRLLLSCNPNHPRAHLTGASYENPSAPPMFCMLLRKHLSGGRIASLTQPPMERVLDLGLDCLDELGAPVEKHLIVEIMGRNSNLILTGPDGRIIDCVRRVDYEMSEKRQVLPGLFYHLPPGQGKRNLLGTDLPTLTDLLLAIESPIRMDKWLTDQFAGISPLIGRELSFRLTGDVETDLSRLTRDQRREVAGGLNAFFEEIRAGRYSPTLLRREEKPSDFTYLPIRQYAGFMSLETAPSFSELLDAFYTTRDQEARLKSRSSAMHKTISNLLSRTIRKLDVQRRELAASTDRERLRQYGDIVTANLYRIQRGQTSLEAEDFYDPDMKQVVIPLLPHLSPQQNAAKFYKDYTKAKHAEQYLTQQIAKGELERTYLESVLDEIQRAGSERELAEIRQELTEGGYLRPSQKKTQKLQASKPRHFVSTEGFHMYVGRNNRQNDQLTLKTAWKTDLWLHTQKIHGSHVIVLCEKEQPGPDTIAQAAMLAALYSQASQSQNVPVDYTQVKNVKNPAGAKPGMVIYDHYNTTWATPDPQMAETLEVKQTR